jgi:hypothetical protein
MALGTAANFGVVGKGGVKIMALEGPVIKTIAVSDEIVRVLLFSKQFSMFPGSNSTINFYY